MKTIQVTSNEKKKTEKLTSRSENVFEFGWFPTHGLRLMCSTLYRGISPFSNMTRDECQITPSSLFTPGNVQDKVIYGKAYLQSGC